MKTLTPQVGDRDYDSEKATAHLTGDIRKKPTYDKSKEHDTAECCWCKAKLYSIQGGKLWRCPREQCFTRQMLYKVSTGKAGTKSEKVHFIPLPIQVVFMEAVLQQNYPYILFGGAAGGSKSHVLRWLAHWLCLRKKGFRVLLLRRKFTQLQEYHINRGHGEALALGAVPHKTEKAIDYPDTGSRLKFGHCETEGDQDNYQGDEYDLILFDEMTHFSEAMLTFIAARTRTGRKATYSDDWMPVVAGGTNPGGIGAQYCLSHFIEKNPDPFEYEFYDPNEYLYLPAKLTNNPYLDKAYYRKLLAMPKVKRQQWIDGDWHAYDGMYFEEFEKSDVVQPDGKVLKSHLKTTHYGPEFERFCSMDWGYSDFGVVLWWVCLSDGKFHIEDEWKFHRLNIPDVCAEIKRRNKARNLTIRATFASPDLQPQTGQIGESRAETFRKNGVPVRKANNQRVPGWQRVREMLRHDPAGEPTLTIDPERCPYLVSTLPQMVSDPKNPEDVAPHKDDHAVEALRYGAMSRPAPTRFPVAPKPIKGTGSELIAAILARLNAA